MASSEGKKEEGHPANKLKDILVIQVEVNPEFVKRALPSKSILVCYDPP